MMEQFYIRTTNDNNPNNNPEPCPRTGYPSESFLGTGGENVITGGSGDDIYNVVNAELPETYNTITDFEAGVDRIGINGLGIGFSDLQLSPNDGNAAIGVPVGDGTFARVAVLLGVDSANLVEDYFDFGESLA